MPKVKQNLLVESGGHNYYITAFDDVRGRMVYLVTRDNAKMPQTFRSKRNIEDYYKNLGGKLGALK